MFKSLYFIFCVAFFMLTSCFYGQVNSSLITIKQAESLSYDSEKTSAKILNGVLYLTIPKKEEAKPKKVTIKVG